MGADTETDSQALVGVKGTLQKILGLRGIKDIARMWSTESTKQGS